MAAGCQLPQPVPGVQEGTGDMQMALELSSLSCYLLATLLGTLPMAFENILLFVLFLNPKAVNICKTFL